jgi:SAM-dependent methyltransferase
MLRYALAMQSDLVDASFPEPRFITPSRWTGLKKAPFWNETFGMWAEEMLKRGGEVLDLGGGLRIVEGKGDRTDPGRVKRLGHLLMNPSLHLRVSDYTDTYHPDCVEDIHHLSFSDATFDAVFCLAVLEHVYDPKCACEELLSVVKPGGRLLVYVPWIYRYHAVRTEDYRDYFRYSCDGLAYLFRDAKEVTLCPVRGLFESLLRFTPLHRIPGLARLTRLLDWSSERMRKISVLQTSGYFVSIVR